MGIFSHRIQESPTIAAPRKREPAVEIEIRWCPAHKEFQVTRPLAGGPISANRTTTGSSGWRLPCQLHLHDRPP